MCGIVGLFLKDPKLEPELGAMLTDMLITMTDRGPDSAGIAIYGGARALLLFAGAIVLLFNTAAILAMLRHYREDRDFMYGIDIKFLDEAKGRRG